MRLNRWATHHATWEVPLALLRVLSQIGEWGEARVTDLARAEHCSQPTMTVRVRALEARRWVARAADPADARSALLTLTGAGRAALADARGARVRVIDALMSRLDAAERRRLADATQALRTLLDAAYAQSSPTFPSES